MTKEEMDFIGSMNMCDEISNEAYQKIMTHCEEQEPCEDCISRKETIEWLKKVTITDGITFKAGFEQILYNIEQMPSVTPQPKAGEWMKNGELCKCSNCDSLVLRSVVKAYNYCFRCGAKMEVET